ncbi:MAG: DUF427 domain-containing protein [Granulosicoccus sp.]|nr:DUF427 domain-containing protein [Granulosicoccus sp.]
MIRESYRVVAPDRFLSTRFIDELVTITSSGTPVVKTGNALELVEGERAAVTYVPLNDVSGAILRESATRFQCRWKGEARYYDVNLPGGETILDGAWAYPSAPDELAAIRSRVAFDPAHFVEQFSTGGSLHDRTG